MRAVRGVAAGCLLVLGGAAGSQEQVESSARRLVGECRLASAYCDTFLSAAIQTHRLMDQYVLMVSGHRLMCLPEAMTLAEARQLVLDYDDRRPKDREVYPAGVYVMTVLEAAYACVQ